MSETLFPVDPDALDNQTPAEGDKVIGVRGANFVALEPTELGDTTENATSAQLTAETQARQAADTSLGEAVVQEAQDRASADGLLQQNIEGIIRTTTFTALTDMINANTQIGDRTIGGGKMVLGAIGTPELGAQSVALDRLAAAVQALINNSATTIAFVGGNLVVTRSDGTTAAPVPLPTGDGIADGVIVSATPNLVTKVVTFGTSTGASVNLDLSNIVITSELTAAISTVTDRFPIQTDDIGNLQVTEPKLPQAVQDKLNALGGALRIWADLYYVIVPSGVAPGVPGSVTKGTQEQFFTNNQYARSAVAANSSGGVISWYITRAAAIAAKLSTLTDFDTYAVHVTSALFEDGEHGAEWARPYLLGANTEGLTEAQLLEYIEEVLTDSEQHPVDLINGGVSDAANASFGEAGFALLSTSNFIKFFVGRVPHPGATISLMARATDGTAISNEDIDAHGVDAAGDDIGGEIDLDTSTRDGVVKFTLPDAAVGFRLSHTAQQNVLVSELQARISTQQEILRVEARVGQTEQTFVYTILPEGTDAVAPTITYVAAGLGEGLFNIGSNGDEVWVAALPAKQEGMVRWRAEGTRRKNNLVRVPAPVPLDPGASGGAEVDTTGGLAILQRNSSLLRSTAAIANPGNRDYATLPQVSSAKTNLTAARAIWEDITAQTYTVDVGQDAGNIGENITADIVLVAQAAGVLDIGIDVNVPITNEVRNNTYASVVIRVNAANEFVEVVDYDNFVKRGDFDHRKIEIENVAVGDRFVVAVGILTGVLDQFDGIVMSAGFKYAGVLSLAESQAPISLQRDVFDIFNTGTPTSNFAQGNDYEPPLVPRAGNDGISTAINGQVNVSEAGSYDVIGSLLTAHGSAQDAGSPARSLDVYLIRNGVEELIARDIRIGLSANTDNPSSLISIALDKELELNDRILARFFVDEDSRVFPAFAGFSGTLTLVKKDAPIVSGTGNFQTGSATITDGDPLAITLTANNLAQQAIGDIITLTGITEATSNGGVLTLPNFAANTNHQSLQIVVREFHDGGGHSDVFRPITILPDGTAQAQIPAGAIGLQGTGLGLRNSSSADLTANLSGLFTNTAPNPAVGVDKVVVFDGSFASTTPDTGVVASLNQTIFEEEILAVNVEFSVGGTLSYDQTGWIDLRALADLSSVGNKPFDVVFGSGHTTADREKLQADGAGFVASSFFTEHQWSIRISLGYALTPGRLDSLQVLMNSLPSSRGFIKVSVMVKRT